MPRVEIFIMVVHSGENKIRIKYEWILPGIALEECEEDLPVSRLGGSGQRRHSSQRIQAVEVNAGHAQ
jgi:hypothetical protein